ncbi:MAG: hypothetical protein KAY12_02285 [Arenimonas sp.]|nr:hypothetical protein [Arenimonas sp.]
MSVTAIILLVVGLYLVFKVAGAVLKLALVVLLLAAAYWLAAPLLDMPLPL